MTLHKSHSGSRIRSNIVVYTGLIVASLLVVLPFAIILVTSFKSITDAQSWEFSLVGKEDGLTVQGYKLFFKYSDYDTGIPWLLTGFLNTMITSLVPTIGSLFFGAVDEFNRRMAEMPAYDHVIFSLRGMPNIDVSGAQAVLELCESLQKQGKTVACCGMADGVRTYFDRTGITALLSENAYFWNAEDAILDLLSAEIAE